MFLANIRALFVNSSFADSLTKAKFFNVLLGTYIPFSLSNKEEYRCQGRKILSSFKAMVSQGKQKDWSEV